MGNIDKNLQLSKLAQLGKGLEQAGKITGKEVLKTTLDTAKQLGKNVAKGFGDDAIKQVFKFIPSLIGDTFSTLIKNKRTYKYVIGTPADQLDKVIGEGSKAALEEISEKALQAAIKDKGIVSFLKNKSGGSSFELLRKLHSENGIKSLELTDDVSKMISEQIADPNFYKTLMTNVEKGIVEGAKVPGPMFDLLKKTQSPTANIIGKAVGTGVVAGTVWTILGEIYDNVRQANMALSEKIGNLESELSNMYRPGLFFENKQPVDFIVQAKKVIDQLKKERRTLSGIEANIALKDRNEETAKANVIANKGEVFGCLKRITLILDGIPAILDSYVSKVANGDYNGTLGLTQLIGKSRDSAKIVKQHIANINADIEVFETTLGEKIVNLNNAKTSANSPAKPNKLNNIQDSEMEEIAKDSEKFSKVNDKLIKNALILFSEVSSFLSIE
jgi:hypothetical protein